MRNRLQLIDVATTTANTLAAMLLFFLGLCAGSVFLPWLVKHGLATITHRLDVLQGVLR